MLSGTKEENNRNECCIEGATTGARSKHRRQALCFVHQLVEKGNVEGVLWPSGRGTGGVFGDTGLLRRCVRRF